MLKRRPDIVMRTAVVYGGWGHHGRGSDSEKGQEDKVGYLTKVGYDTWVFVKAQRFELGVRPLRKQRGTDRV